MNDWVILAIIALVASEIIFITFRIKFNHLDWVMQKVLSFVLGLFVGAVQLLVVVGNPKIGDPIIFHWERLMYEFYTILGIVILLIVNYVIVKLIDKFVKGRKHDG